MTEMITEKQFDSYARRIERRNLKLRGRSLTALSISRRANCFIVDIRNDGTLLVRDGWREAMRLAEETT